MKDFGSASAPGKIILLGEHFVVYGCTAILCSIDKRVAADARMSMSGRVAVNSAAGADGDSLALIHDAVARARGVEGAGGVDITVHSEIPVGIGLGSSAAACVATIAAVQSLFRQPSREQVCKLAVESEKLVHEDTSGADCYVSTFGGLMRFSKAAGMRGIEAKKPITLVVGNTGVPHSTGAMVSVVRAYRDENADRFRELSENSEEICADAALALERGDESRMGELMNQSQLLLEEIGVTHPKAREIIKIAKDGGALGAKVTGAGGGGAVVALAWPDDTGRLVRLIRAAGYSSFESRMDHKGLVIS